MTCQKCGSNRIAVISGKCSDLCSVDVPGFELHHGYVPDFIGEYGDYIRLKLCLDCGQVQGTFPIPDSDLTELTPEEEEDEENY